MYDINKLKELASMFNVEVSFWSEDQDKLQMVGTNGDINKFFEEAKRQGLLDKDPFDESYDPEDTSWIDDVRDALKGTPNNAAIEKDPFLKELRDLYYKYYSNADKSIKEELIMERMDFATLYQKVKAQDRPIHEGFFGNLLFDTSFAHELYDEFYKPLTTLIKAGDKEGALKEYNELATEVKELANKKYAKTFVAVQKKRLAEYKEQIDAMEDASVEEPVAVESLEESEDIDTTLEEAAKPSSAKLRIEEMVKDEFETGHRLAYDYEDFKEGMREEGFRGTPTLWDYYQELRELGPAGFYEEFKDKFEFDDMFISEYGREEEDDDEDLDDYEESYTPISEDIDDDFETPNYKAENVEFVMNEYIADEFGVESLTKVNDTTYKLVYDGTEVEIVFDFGWDEWVYNINGKGPFAHSSYEWLLSDIRNVIDDEPIKESYFEDEPSWLDDDDPVEADREHANLYGGDRTYCDTCGSKLAMDEWGGYCPKCNPLELEEGFDTHSDIDLDMVGVRVANLLDIEALGEDNWIEFDCQDSRSLIGTPDLHMGFEATGSNKMLRGYMRTHTDGTIDVYIKNGSEGKFRNPEEIARFIAGQFNISI